MTFFPPSEKEKEDQVVGRPQVGGPFTLTNHKGETFTEKDLLGKWSLIYFGFTNCPDICPEELDKMSAAVEKLGALSVHLLPTPMLISLLSLLHRTTPTFPRHILPAAQTRNMAP